MVLINGNSDILMKTPNSQLKVAGTFDLDGDLIVDSNSFAKFHDDSTIENANLKLIDGSVEFTDNSDTKSLSIKITDGLLVFDETANVDVISIFEIDGGLVNGRGSSVIHQINDLIVTNNGFIHLNESSSITLSSSKLVLSDDSSFVLEDFASINTSITEILLEDSALFELTNDNCNLELLVLDLTQDSVFNVSCPNTVQITTFNHYDGTRTGNTDIQAENYHWTSGLLSSDSQVSTTFVTNSGIFDDNSSFNTKSREIDNHFLVLSGDVDWLTNDLNLLNNARLEVNSNGVFSIDVDSNAKVSTNDDTSIFVNNGQVSKNCGFDLTINCLFDNSGEFVVSSGSLNLEHTSRILNGFLTVDSILNINDELIVEADGLINGNSDILMKTPNSQLKVAGTFDLDGDLIVDSNSFAKFHDDSTIENANLKLIDGSVEFTDNSDTKSLSIKITDGLLVFDETANVDVISIFEIDGGLVNGRGSSVIHQINDLIVTNNGFIHLNESSSITLSSSKLVLSDDSSFVLEDFASINTSITEILLEDSALFELTNDNCNLELLVLDLTQDSVFNVSCPNTVQITTFNHYDGTRTGNTDIQAENYHWTSGLLSSDSQVSTTFVTNSGIFDDNSSFNTKSREIDNHLLVISGGVDWLTNDLNLLNNARLEVNSNGVFSIDVDSNAKVSTNDDNSIFVNNGQVSKNCGFDLTINSLFDNSGEFVVNSGSLNLEHTSRILNGFLTVDSILNVNDQLIVEADGLINGNSDIVMKTPNSQLKVAGTFDLDGDLIVDSNSFAKFHDDSTIENANLKLIDGSVEFTDNSDTKSLSIKITDGLLVFDETANVDVISIFEIDGGLVNGRGSSVIHQINDLIVTNNGFIYLNESSSITLSSSKLVLSDDSSFVLDDFASINTSITEILLEDSALFELTNDNCNLELLVLDLTQDSVFNVSCPNTVQITTFNHYDGTRTGNTDIQAENYHWTSGLLSSDSQVSTTFVTNSGIFDDNSSFNTKSREIDNHLLGISGGVDWLTNDLNLLNNARLEVNSNGVFSIDVDSNAKVSTNDDTSIFVNNGQVSKNCGFDLTINCLFDNSGEFVVNSGSLNLEHTSRILNGFLTVDSILNINDELIVEADGLINGNSDILMKTPNSQLKVAGTFDLDGDLIVDSNSFAKFHDDSTIENANLKLIDGSVEFTDNSDTKSLSIKIADGLLVFDETANVDVISIFEIDGGLVNGRGSSVIHQINDLIVTNNGFIHLNESSSITLSSSKLVLSDDSSFVLEDFASINTSTTEILLEDSALFELTNDNCNLELLVLDLTQDSVFNVSCPNTVQITTFNHYDGTRTGNTDIQAENYHWTSGLLSSDSQVSTTFVTNSGIFDDNSSFNTKSREIEYHFLVISGGVDWLTNDLNLHDSQLTISATGLLSVRASELNMFSAGESQFFINGSVLLNSCQVLNVFTVCYSFGNITLIQSSVYFFDSLSTFDGTLFVDSDSILSSLAEAKLFSVNDICIVSNGTMKFHDSLELNCTIESLTSTPSLFSYSSLIVYSFGSILNPKSNVSCDGCRLSCFSLNSHLTVVNLIVFNNGFVSSSNILNVSTLSVIDSSVELSTVFVSTAFFEKCSVIDSLIEVETVELSDVNFELTNSEILLLQSSTFQFGRFSLINSSFILSPTSNVSFNHLFSGIYCLDNSSIVVVDGLSSVNVEVLQLTYVLIPEGGVLMIKSNATISGDFVVNGSLHLLNDLSLIGNLFTLPKSSIFGDWTLSLTNSKSILQEVLDVHLLAFSNTTLSVEAFSFQVPHLHCTNSSLQSTHDFTVEGDFQCVSSTVTSYNEFTFNRILQRHCIFVADNSVFNFHHNFSVSDDLSLFGNGSFILLSGVEMSWFGGNIELNGSYLTLSSGSILSTLCFNQCSFIGSTLSHIINDGIIDFSSSHELFIEPLLTNNHILVLCSTRVVFSKYGLINHGQVLSCDDPDLSVLELSEGIAHFNYPLSYFVGSVLFSGANATISYVISTNIEVTGGHVVLASNVSHVKPFSLNISCTGHHGNYSDDVFWFEYCDNQAVVMSSNSSISSITVHSGVVRTQLNVSVNSLYFKSNQSILHIPLHSTVALKPGPFDNELMGPIVGQGILVMDSGVCVAEDCNCFHDDDCALTCAEITSCERCVSHSNCGWTIDIDFCDSAVLGGFPRFVDYENWLYGTCELCRLVDTLSPLNYQFELITNDFDSLFFDIFVPYSRDGTTFYIDFHPFTWNSLNNVSQCSNKVSFENYQRSHFSRSAPHSNISTALNSEYYPAYGDSNIWHQEAAGCHLVRYSTSFSHSDLLSCDNIGIKFSFRNDTPFIQFFGDTYVHLVNASARDVILFEKSFHFVLNSLIVINNVTFSECVDNHCIKRRLPSSMNVVDVRVITHGEHFSVVFNSLFDLVEVQYSPIATDLIKISERSYQMMFSIPQTQLPLCFGFYNFSIENVSGQFISMNLTSLPLPRNHFINDKFSAITSPETTMSSNSMEFDKMYTEHNEGPYNSGSQAYIHFIGHTDSSILSSVEDSIFSSVRVCSILNFDRSQDDPSLYMDGCTKGHSLVHSLVEKPKTRASIRQFGSSDNVEFSGSLPVKLPNVPVPTLVVLELSSRLLSNNEFVLVVLVNPAEFSPASMFVLYLGLFFAILLLSSLGVFWYRKRSFIKVESLDAQIDGPTSQLVKLFSKSNTKATLPAIEELSERKSLPPISGQSPPRKNGLPSLSKSKEVPHILPSFSSPSTSKTVAPTRLHTLMSGQTLPSLRNQPTKKYKKTVAPSSQKRGNVRLKPIERPTLPGNI
ncbi:hypothetical protein P9112_003153 [Eukaryota sp. TZLM1-RC]